MNNTQLNRLLKKKGWTGKEVGQLLFSSLFNDVKNQGKEVKDPPLFSQADFEKIESSLETERDYTIYGVYRDLYSSIIDSFNRGQGLYQQFYNGYYRLLLELREVQHTEDAQKSIDKIPLIMTESQYKRLKEEAIATLSGYKESFSSLLFHCLDQFLNAEEEYTKAEAPAIWEAIEATKKKPAKGNRFLSVYNSTYGEGYYSLPDGRRSDQMTSEEWQGALYEEFLKRHKLTKNGEKATPEETVSFYNQKRLLESYELFFKGGETLRERLEETGIHTDKTDEELEEALNHVIDFVGKNNITHTEKQIAELLEDSTPTTWHTYEESPEGLTLYDLLDLYTEEERGGLDTEPKEAIKHLKKDAPDLYNALKAYIEEKVPQAKGLKANQLQKDIISWGELATLGAIGYSDLIQPDDRQIIDIATQNEDTTENQSKRLRTMFSGIATLTSPSSSQVDEKGDYIEPKDPLLSFNTIYSLEGNTALVSELYGYIDALIYPAMRYLYSFNALMEIMGDIYDLPELVEVVTLDISLFEGKMEAYNNILYMLYHDIYGNEEEKQHKREILKYAFRTLETDTLKPTEQAKEDIREELKKLGYSSEARKKLKYLDAILDHLMYTREGA